MRAAPRLAADGSSDPAWYLLRAASVSDAFGNGSDLAADVLDGHCERILDGFRMQAVSAGISQLNVFRVFNIDFSGSSRLIRLVVPSSTFSFASLGSRRMGNPHDPGCGYRFRREITRLRDKRG